MVDSFTQAHLLIYTDEPTGIAYTGLCFVYPCVYLPPLPKSSIGSALTETLPGGLNKSTTPTQSLVS